MFFTVAASAISALFAANAVGPVAAHAVHTVEPTQAVRSGPADLFAADITERTGRGWRIRDLAVDVAEEEIELSITLAGIGEAERFTLSFDPDAGVVHSYQASAVLPSTERRIYPAGRALLRLLAKGGPSVLHQELDSYLLEVGAESVSLSPSAYYIVEARADGAAAGELAARALADALTSGMVLVATEEAVDSTGQVVELILNDGGDGAGGRVVHLGMDRNGQVISAEIRRRPSVPSWQEYAAGDSLVADLRAGKALRGLEVETTAQGVRQLVGTMDGGVRFIIEPADFENNEEYEGC